MLGTGLILANVPGGVVAAFPAKWGVQMRAAALATIFLRCGLELEFKVRTGAIFDRQMHMNYLLCSASKVRALSCIIVTRCLSQGEAASLSQGELASRYSA